MRSTVLVGILFVVMVATSSAASAAGRVSFVATGETVFDPNIGGFVGSADVVLDGEATAADVVTFLLGEPAALPSGIQLARTSHQFGFGDLDGDGTDDGFTTTDFAILFPTELPGIFSLRTTLLVVDGTGMFEDAGGTLRLPDGLLDLINGTAAWTMSGRISLND